jgi:hypothetical protein
VVALAAYFDDSKNNDEGIFAVAGYLSMVSMWEDSFAPAWREVIKSAPRSIKEFKAADCRHRTNEFEGWEPDECKALTTQLVDVIVGPSIPSLVGIGAAVSIENFAELQEETRQRFERFAYLLCGGVVVDAVFQLTEQYVGKDDVTFIFDEQDELEARMRVVFKDLKQVLPLQFANKIRNPLFEPSEAHAALQAADLLAYEAYKELKNRRENPPRRISIALQRLVDGKRHGARYLGREQLTEIGQHIKNGTRTSSGFYNLPTLYNSVDRVRIRAAIEP